MSIELALIRQGGVLVPARQADEDALRTLKAGEVVRFRGEVMRNGAKFRCWWLLVEFAYDIWRENLPTMQHEGQDVRPEVERFRKDLTVMAGFCRPTWSLDGVLTLEPESIAWASMSEARFERLYSATIQVILDKILSGSKYDEQTLRNHIDRLMSFD